MSADDANHSAEPAKKPGFLRRLFGAMLPEPEAGTEVEPPHPDATGEQTVDTPTPEAAALLDPDAPPPIPSLQDAGESDPEAFFDRAAHDPALDRASEAPQLEPAPAQPAETPEGEPEPARPNWWTRLRQGLSRSSSSIGQGITEVFTKRKLDATTLEDLDDILIRADLGIATAARVTEALAKGRFDKTIDPLEVKAVLAQQIEATLLPVAQPFVLPEGIKPFTILMIGVNGSGKTTTIGKLAAKFTASGKTVMLAAGDTFRAAAIEQLRVWGARTGSPVVSREDGADAAGLAFDALKQAQASGTDVLLIDTAGRLQNRTELMDELAKVIRVIRKLDPLAPHAVLLVLDATVGQNALSQVEIFSRVAGVTGLIMTKLDGTARGGILVAIAEKFALPVHFIGIGEAIDDLEPFEARDFARAIAGIDDEDRP